MTTASLDIVLVIEGQTNKEGTIATAQENLEQATQAALAVDLTAGHVTLSDTEFTRHFYFNCTGHSAARNLTVPLQVNGSDPAPRFFCVKNGGTAAITVKGSSGATVSVLAGRTALVQSDGTDMRLISSVATYDAHDVGGFGGGTLSADQLLIRYAVTRSFTIPLNAAGSVCKVGTNPTSTATLTIKKNGSSIGSVSINTSGVASFTFSSAVSFVSGDVLSVQGQASPDATLADVSITLAGTKD